MKYMGSKNRIAKHILPIILKDRKPQQWYVEPFVGGANMIDKVEGHRIGADSNSYIINMWRGLVAGDGIAVRLTKDDYKDIKENKDMYPEAEVGWAGIACSYCGIWFTGFAGVTKTAGGVRDYQQEAINNVNKQIPNLVGVQFVSSVYQQLEIPNGSIVYCDPPYANTAKYKDEFDHVEFWDWCRNKVAQGHQVFISEYSAPCDFICVWEREVKSSLSANGRSGKSKSSTEKLFVHRSQHAKQ